MADAFIMDGDADDAALWEIDENFARAELTDAQRAEHHVRREEILKRKGLVKDAPKGGRPAKNSGNLPAYSEKAATDLGVDVTTIRRDLRRGRDITPDVLAEVAGTDLDKGVVLDELARTPAADQRLAGRDHPLSRSGGFALLPARAPHPRLDLGLFEAVHIAGSIRGGGQVAARNRLVHRARLLARDPSGFLDRQRPLKELFNLD